MNRNCNGHWYPALGLYRCLMDGEFYKTKKEPSVCKRCKRAVQGETVPGAPPMRVIVTTQKQIWSSENMGFVDFGVPIEICETFK